MLFVFVLWNNYKIWKTQLECSSDAIQDDETLYMHIVYGYKKITTHCRCRGIISFCGNVDNGLPYVNFSHYICVDLFSSSQFQAKKDI